MIRSELHQQNNDFILGRLHAAEVCVKWLKERGFAILSVEIAGRNPVVWIQNSSRCQQLSSALLIRRQGLYGTQRVMVAVVEGCQVQWKTSGH